MSDLDLDLNLELDRYCCKRMQRARRPRLPDLPLYMPAMPPLGLIAWLRRRIDTVRCRRQLRALLARDDRQLADIGHSRAAIERALGDDRRSD